MLNVYEKTEFLRIIANGLDPENLENIYREVLINGSTDSGNEYD
jgi:hypothetical protein